MAKRRKLVKRTDGRRLLFNDAMLTRQFSDSNLKRLEDAGIKYKIENCERDPDARKVYVLKTDYRKANKTIVRITSSMISR